MLSWWALWRDSVWCLVLLGGFLGFVREILLEKYGEDVGCTMPSYFFFFNLLACFLDLVREHLEHHRKSFEEVNIYDCLFFSFG